MAARKRDATDPFGYTALRDDARTALPLANDQHQAVATYLVLVCNALGWPAGIFYAVDTSQPRMLLPTHHVCLRARSRGNLLDLIATRDPAEEFKGLAGRVLDTGKPAWIASLETADHFTASILATSLGLRAAIAIPIYIGGPLRAVAEFYPPKTLEPVFPLLDALVDAGACLGNRLATLARSPRPTP